MRYHAWRGALWLGLALLLVGCTSPTAAPSAVTPGSQEPGVEQAYPVSSPVNTPESYPGRVTPPVPTLPPGEAPVRIDKPVVAGTTVVTGSGTPGLPIVLHNVTFMGEVMGQTTIDDNGRFSINVPPLEANVRVGIWVGDLAGTRWTLETFQAPGYQGDEAMALPNVGNFLDTALVAEP